MLNDSRLDHAFAALSDPTRRTMLARPLSMSLPAVLQHLQALQASGLVRSDKQGRVRTVRLEPGVLTQAEQWLTDTRSEWEAHADRLELHLDKMKKEEK